MTRPDGYPPGAPTLDALLREAWEHRFNQRQEECFRVFSRITLELPLLKARDPATLETALGGPRRAAYLSGYCLQASFDRWARRTAEAEALLGALAELLERRREIAPAVLSLQRGLNSLSRGEAESAMEAFLEAATRAEGKFEALCAEINLLQCLEFLGLPRAEVGKRVANLLESSRGKWDLSSFEESFEHLQIREWFRTGQVARVARTRVEAIGSHNDFLRLWIQQLPYHAHSLPQASLEMLRFRSTLFHRSYRLRTLYGLSHPEEETDVRPSEWVDRIYLWVWRWLVWPEGTTLAEVLKALTTHRISDVENRLSAEDRALLRNAIGWLALFDSATASLVTGLTRRLLRGNRPSAPLLELEFLLLQYWVARRDRDPERAERYRRLFRADSLADSRDIFFCFLFPGADPPPPLADLAARLTALTQRSHQITSPVVVNLSSYEVTSRPLGKTVASQPLSVALDLLARKPRVRLDEFAFVVFEILRYDPLVHNPRIYNLLARLKELTRPHLRLQVKAGVLIAEGKWEAITVVRDPEESVALHRSAEWKTFLAPALRPSSEDNSATRPHIPPRPVMSRRELEGMLGKSRATVTRRLNEWRRRGWVKRRRLARATQYVLSHELIQKLNEGDLWI